MAIEQTLSGLVNARVSISESKAFDNAAGNVTTKQIPGRTISSASVPVSDLIYEDTLVLAGGASSTIDLRGAAIINYYGQFAVFATVRAIWLRNITTGAASGESIVKCGGGANPFLWAFAHGSDALSIPPGGFHCAGNGEDAGWPVVAGTGDQLTFINLDGANSATLEIVIVGEST